MEKEKKQPKPLTPEERGKMAVGSIIENYLRNEASLVQQLQLQAGIHDPTTGGFRETVWCGMFEQILPKKFAIEQSVFIIDSKGYVSREVDLAIFDEMYTPYIFHFGKLKFLPIEAVAVVIECKSTSPNKTSLKKWVKSIAALRTSQESCVRIVSGISCGINRQDQPPAKPQSQTQTRPLRILCYLEDASERYGDFTDIFDMVITASSEPDRLSIRYDPGKDSLQQWYLALNHAGGEKNIISGDVIKDILLSEFEVRSEGRVVSLLTLNLQLNQLLMLINNPIWFPHKAYVDMFNHYKDNHKKEEG